jgi:diguanylate cyclase (GGDEF)-like protein/PAS domain S-box-containing protein
MDRCIKEEYYRFIFENSMDAFLLTSPDGNIYRANAAACQMFQRSEEEICQLGRKGLVDLTDPRLEKALKVREELGSVHSELNFIRKDGTVFPTDCTSAIFNDAEGKRWTIIIIRDISVFKAAETVLRRAEEDARRYATFDYLTGLLNRRAFIEKLHQEFNRAKREKQLVSLMLLDIDYLKQVNDRLGHKAGDYLIQTFGKSILEKLRPYDFLGRYGGDEFIICMPNTTPEVALEIGERLRSHIENKELAYEDTTLKMTASIGICSYDYHSDENPDSLIAKVDENMYRAKQHRNAVFGYKK